jgi:hypothetical protein
MVGLYVPVVANEGPGADQRVSVEQPNRLTEYSLHQTLSLRLGFMRAHGHENACARQSRSSTAAGRRIRVLNYSGRADGQPLVSKS